jgi:hypothetical protein
MTTHHLEDLVAIVVATVAAKLETETL